MSGKGAERVLDAIEWFATTIEPVTYTDFVQALDIPKSSAVLLLRLLVSRGYLERLPDNRYELIRLPGEGAEAGASWAAILRLADRHLKEAVSLVGETGFVAVLDNNRIRYLNKILPNREILYDRDIATSRLPHQVASGLIMLAHFSPEELENYFQEAEVPCNQQDTIREALEKARIDGIYVNNNGVVEGAAGAASAVKDAQGKVVAAINISGPRERFIQDIDRIKEAVISVASAVSMDLVHRTRK